MSRTIKEATVKRLHYDSHDQLRTHLADFMAAYNFARRLKTLSRLTPYEYIEDLDVRAKPIHRKPGPTDTGTKHLTLPDTIQSSPKDLAVKSSNLSMAKHRGHATRL